MQANAMERGNVLSEQVTRKLVMLSIQNSAIEQAIGLSDENYDQKIKAITETIEMKQTEFNKLDASHSDYEKAKKSFEDFKKQKEDFIKGNPKLGVIQKVLESGNDIKFERFTIKKSFPKDEDVTLFDDEISEFAINGFIGKFEVSEKPPIDW
jgi:hypothetical protein